MMGDNIARLRVLVPVTTHAAEPVKMDSPKGVDHSTNDDGPFGIGSITIPSLPDLASNGLLLPQTIVFDSRNRPKLSRATTVRRFGNKQGTPRKLPLLTFFRVAWFIQTYAI